MDKVVDSHEYESEPKVKLGETLIPKVFLPFESTQRWVTHQTPSIEAVFI